MSKWEKIGRLFICLYSSYAPPSVNTTIIILDPLTIAVSDEKHSLALERFSLRWRSETKLKNVFKKFSSVHFCKGWRFEISIPAYHEVRATSMKSWLTEIVPGKRKEEVPCLFSRRICWDWWKRQKMGAWQPRTEHSGRPSQAYRPVSVTKTNWLGKRNLSFTMIKPWRH